MPNPTTPRRPARPRSAKAPRAAATRALPILPILLALGFVGGASSLAAQQAAAKIAVVDLDQVVAKSQAGQELQAKLEQFQKDAQAQADKLAQAASDLQKRISDGRQSLSEETLADLQKQLEDKTVEMRRFRDDKQREGQQIQNDGLDKVEKQLRPVFKAIREEGGYDLILNKVPGVVVSSSDRIDITAEVIDRLDKAQPAAKQPSGN